MSKKPLDANLLNTRYRTIFCKKVSVQKFSNCNCLFLGGESPKVDIKNKTCSIFQVNNKSDTASIDTLTSFSSVAQILQAVNGKEELQ